MRHELLTKLTAALPEGYSAYVRDFGRVRRVCLRGAAGEDLGTVPLDMFAERHVRYMLEDATDHLRRTLARAA